jgi:hypothetical protein
MLALSMGFGSWWIYFDLVGNRLPRANRVALANWVMSHLPIALAIAAAGAGMVSLIGHARPWDGGLPERRILSASRLRPSQSFQRRSLVPGSRSACGA